jgi:hypothetical protein
MLPALNKPLAGWMAVIFEIPNPLIVVVLPLIIPTFGKLLK